MSRPAFTALMRAVTIVLGGTRRKRIPTRVKRPTYAPEANAAIQIRTGIRYRTVTSTATTRIRSANAPKAPLSIPVMAQSFLGSRRTTIRLPSTRTTVIGSPASMNSPSETTSTRSPSMSAIPAGRSRDALVPPFPTHSRPPRVDDSPVGHDIPPLAFDVGAPGRPQLRRRGAALAEPGAVRLRSGRKSLSGRQLGLKHEAPTDRQGRAGA